MDIFINEINSMPLGFSAFGTHIGIKKAKKDLALIVSDVPAEMAGCFTKNIVKAAPVKWDMQLNDSSEKMRGIIVNSGNANACTGKQGEIDNYEMAKTLSKCVQGTKPENFLVCSTGVIGVPMPVELICNGIKSTFEQLLPSPEGGKLASEAIMTTDTFSKTITVKLMLDGKPVTIFGMAKGSGMIHPNMATMLSFILTDANIDKKMLQKALSHSTLDSYNMISVDGDSSTNDTVLVLANGLAENAQIKDKNDDYFSFLEALDTVNKYLAVEIAKDGEGATKLMEVTVDGAKTKDDARTIARSVVSSNLFKAALFGEDANWGRVLCAMGYSGADFDTLGVTIKFRSTHDDIVYDSVCLMEHGVPIVFDEKFAKIVLSKKKIYIDIFLSDGDETATAWGCDLTYDYVKINGDYRS